MFNFGFHCSFFFLPPLMRLCHFIIMLMVVACAAGQTLRPVSEEWMVQVGSSQLADTYLTPLKYSGMHWGVQYSRAQAMRFDPGRWINALAFAVDYDRADNRVRNSVMHQAIVGATWSMLRRWSLRNGLSLSTGGFADLTVGALLLARNSNNPAQARAAVTAGPEATLRWRTHRMWGGGMVLRTPLLGAFFAPGYGELYYEMALGNRSGLVHCAWPGSYRRLQAEVYGELRPRCTALRLGYRADLLSFSANGITCRSLTHSFTVAIAIDFVAINPHADEANIVLPY